MDKNLLDLDIQLCHKLYVASNSLTRMYRPYLDEIGLTYPQYIVMLVLWQFERTQSNAKPKINMSFGELCKVSHIDKGALSLMLKKIVDKNLIELIPGKYDARMKDVKLTRKGKALQAKAQRVPEQMGQHFTKMTASDFAKLNKLMDKFLSDLS